MSEISQQEYDAQKHKIAIALTVQDASEKKHCSNCFMGMGLKWMAGATIPKHDREFCSHECLREWEDMHDEYA